MFSLVGSLAGFAVVAHKDVVLAVLASAAGLGGLTLVFLGLVVSTFQSLGVVTPEVKSRYRRLGLLVTGDFMIGLLSVGAATWWLIDLGTLGGLYTLAVVAFLVQVVGLAAATALVVWRLMWGV